MKLKITLIAIVLLAAFLRFHQLGSNPQIVNRDEAALGYNALLLSKIGKDEWGKSWPLTLKSFGDYKLPGYTWFLIPLFKIFTANDFLLRLPSALAGTVLVILSYFLAKRFKLKEKGAAIFALLIALNPVFIFYSRMAWEANLALSILIASLLCLTAKKYLLNFLGVLLIILACFTYNTPFLLLPFIIIFYILWKRKDKNFTKWFIAAFLTLVLIIMSQLLIGVTSQKSSITIFNDASVRANYIQYRLSLSRPLQTIIGNKYFYFLSLTITKLIQSFSYKFISQLGGQHPWHTIPGHGHLYTSTYILGLIGIIYTSWLIVIKKKKLFKKSLLLIFLLLAIIPAAITTDAPHATRSLLFFYLFTLFAVIALKTIVQQVKNKKRLCLLFLIILSIETSIYLYHYFYIYPHHQSVLKPGFKQKIQYLDKNFPQQQIAIVDPSGYQYISAAWYLQTKPEQYYQTIIMQAANTIGLHYGQQLSNYHFIAQEQDRSINEKIILTWEKGQWVIKYY